MTSNVYISCIHQFISKFGRDIYSNKSVYMACSCEKPHRTDSGISNISDIWSPIIVSDRDHSLGDVCQNGVPKEHSQSHIALGDSPWVHVAIHHSQASSLLSSSLNITIYQCIALHPATHSIYIYLLFNCSCQSWIHIWPYPTLATHTWNKRNNINCASIIKQSLY